MKYGTTAARLNAHCGPYAEEVMQRTGLSRDALAEAIYEGGLKFIEDFPLSIQILERSRAFWRWYMLHWYSVDANFLKVQLPAGYQETDIRNAYLEYHTRTDYISCIPGAVWEMIDNDLKKVEIICA